MVTNTVSVFVFKKIMIFHIETKGRQKQFSRNKNFMSLSFYFFLVYLICVPYRIGHKVFVGRVFLSWKCRWLRFCRILEFL